MRQEDSDRSMDAIGFFGTRIEWTRCARRRWPAVPDLHFTPQERRKSRNVLLYWWAGEGERVLPEGCVPIQAGMCHWSRPGFSYACRQNPQNPLGVTVVHFDLIDQFGCVVPPDSEHLPPERLHVRDHRLVSTVTQWIAEKAMEQRAGVAVPAPILDAASHLLLGLVMSLVNDSPQGPSMSDRAEQYEASWTRLMNWINGNLHERLLVRDLAARAGYTRSHFTRLFSAHVGLSPKNYVTNAKLALAKELLRNTSLSISQVAERSGHGDPYQFSRSFRKKTGMSPSRYRELSSSDEG